MERARIPRRGFMCAAGCLAASAFTGRAPADAPEAARDANRVATFSCDVTPPLGTPIYSGYKPLAVIEHPLLAKGVVIDSGGKRYVLCAVDWCEICNGTHTMFRQRIADAVSTDISRVAVQTVHQHTAPMACAEAVRLLESAPNPPPHTPISLFEDTSTRIAEAAKHALGSLTPFDQIGTSQSKVDRVASNRRVPIGDGKVGFRASSGKDEKLRAMSEGQIDPFLKTITFAHANQPLVRLHYYATHPQSFYGDPRASYDVPGIARERLQEKEKVFQIYFTGCAGDIAMGKYNDGSPGARDELAQRLFDGMEASCAATHYAPAETVAWKTTALALTPREDGSFSESACQAGIANEKGTTNDRMNYADTMAFRARSNTPIELSALQMGKVHILHLPGESMIDYQLFAQQLLPDAFVAVAAYGDCGPGYICLEKSFAEGGYEPTASCVVPTSEAALRAAIGRLL